MEKLSFPKSTELVDYYPLGISYVYLHIFGPIRLMLLDTFHETISNHGFDMIMFIEG